MWHSGGRRQLEGFIPQSRCLPWERPGTQQCIHVKRYRLFAKCIYKGLRAHCDMCVPEFGCLFAYIWIRLLYLSSILHFFLFGAGFQSINAPFFFFLQYPVQQPHCVQLFVQFTALLIHKAKWGSNIQATLVYSGHLLKDLVSKACVSRCIHLGECIQKDLMSSNWRINGKPSK